MPIIVILEAHNSGCRMQFLRAGADKILQRPITGKALLSRLRSLLRRRRAHQEFTLRADTNRALGFHEAKAVFQSKPKCVVIQIHHDQTHAMLDKFHALKEYSLEITKTARERLASFFELLALRAQPAPAAGLIPRVELPLSREETANYLGLTLETVSRQLSQLKAQGILEFHDRRHFSVLDRAGLQAASGSDEKLRKH